MISNQKQYDAVIVGGGPAGVLTSYMLAKAGRKVLLLEAYKDFNRQFRGDTLNPLAMGFLDQLGLMDEILELPHEKVEQVKAVGAEGIEAFDLTYRRMPSKFPFVMVIAQPIFLNFLVQKAEAFPNFNLRTQARVNDIIEENGTVTGVQYKDQQGKLHQVYSKLVIGADGRNSVIRKKAGLPTIQTTEKTDYVVWFKLPTEAHDPQEGLVAREERFSTLFMFRRPDEWQISLTLKKDVDYKSWKARGIEQMRAAVTEMVPEFKARLETVEWADTALLPVDLKRATKWYRDGLLVIGDAAHVMSPFGGIGINVALRDAVIVANQLSDVLATGRPSVSQLRRVQKRVEWEVKLLQRIQAGVQDSASKPDEVIGLPPIARFILRIPIIRDLPIFLLSFGLVPVWVNRKFRPSKKSHQLQPVEVQ